MLDESLCTRSGSKHKDGVLAQQALPDPRRLARQHRGHGRKGLPPVFDPVKQTDRRKANTMTQRFTAISSRVD
jgi:hypothetical protein